VAPVPVEEVVAVVVVLGAMEGAEVGGRESACGCWKFGFLARGTPLTTRGGVGLGVMFSGVEYVEVGPGLWERGSLFGAGEFVLLNRPLE